MALSLFPASIEASRFASPSLYLPKLSVPRSKISQRDNKLRFFRPQVGLSDPYVLELAEVLEESLPSTSLPTPFQKLRDSSAESLLATPWPTRKDEPFRFTDISFIKSSKIHPIISPPDQSSDFFSDLEGTQVPNLFIGDGYLLKSVSLSELPEGVYVGSLFSISSEPLLERISQFVSSSRGDLFWSLNGVGTPDWIVVYVPEGCKVEKPLHLRYFSIEGSEKDSKTLPISNPRVLVVVERGGEIGIVEEYMGEDGDKCYWTNSVIEVIIGEEGKVKHSYIQTQSMSSAHIKWTSVKQESTSNYELIEVSTGGKLSRHNVHVQQQGPDTVTELSTFHLSTGSQTQDLHSKLVLDHPRGVSRQLHKCIVAHSQGQAVFDGNVQVNRFAQQTDAGQLTRSLLLEPRATVNVKPNLQIIADDVKCSHGAAISDLEEDQLFYFRARGIDGETARRALIFSFAAEVVDRFPNSSVKKKVENHIRKLLDSTAP